jgi:hypothetical protein
LHIYLATQPDRESDFIAFAVRDEIVTSIYDTPKCLQGLMDIVETYLFCKFQALPWQLLRVWLPPCAVVRDEIGLNVYAPLGPSSRQLLAGSTDPELREYFDWTFKGVLEGFIKTTDNLPHIRDRSRVPENPHLSSRWRRIRTVLIAQHAPNL